MTKALKPIPLRFWKSTSGREPVREWLSELRREDKRIIGRDLAKMQFGWPVDLPLAGLWAAACGRCARRSQAGARRECYLDFMRAC